MEEQSEMTEENASHEDQLPLYDLIKSGTALFLPVALPLQIEISGVSIRMSSVSVGNLPDSCLIIKYPSTGTSVSVASKLFKGSKITVRYISNGNVFGFQSELLGMISDPVRLLFISYPTFIARHSLRSDRRVECYLPADLRVDTSVKDLDIVRDGIITDISSAGCNFNMVRVPLDSTLLGTGMNDPVVLRLQLPGMEGRIELSGNIRNMQRGSRKTSMGIQFNDVDEEKKMKIIEFISTLEKFSWQK
jgi:c-di-GMP-binding flagellar brake protein YcgR